MKIKVVDTEKNSIENVAMSYKGTVLATSDGDGDISITSCHGQSLKEVSFAKDGFCKFEHELDIEESPSYFLQVVLRKSISNEIVYYQSGEVPIIKSTRVASVQDWGFGYKVHFKVTLTKDDGVGNTPVNVLHVTQGGDDSVDGDRMPAVFLLPKDKKLQILSDVNGIDMNGIDVNGEVKYEHELTKDTEIDVCIEFKFNAHESKGSLVYKIDNAEVTKYTIGTVPPIEADKVETDTKPKVYQNADLYLSNVWSESAAEYVTVKDLSVISTNPISKFFNFLSFSFIYNSHFHYSVDGTFGRQRP